MSANGIAVTVSGVARTEPGAAFAAIAPVDLTRIFTGMGPLPGVAGTRGQTGAWDHVGATRTVFRTHSGTSKLGNSTTGAPRFRTSSGSKRSRSGRSSRSAT